MSDRTSAGIFADVFCFLAEMPDSPEKTAFAEKMWAAARGYDFSPRQLECNEVLTKLGFAKKMVDPEYPDEGEVTMYRQGDGSFF